MRSSWIAGRVGRPDAAVRLFCVAHAGGGGSFFLPWQPLLGPEIEGWPVVLPGREGRLRELPYVRMEQAVDPLYDALREHVDRPFALFGHSMGAVVAYEVARRFTAEGGPQPARLFVSARRAPHLPMRRQSFAGLPDDVFLRAVADLNGTPQDVLSQPELISLFLPCLRADFELNDTYVPLPGPRLACPISAFVGDDDPEADHDEVRAWSQVTSGTFSFRAFDGDHFYLKGGRPDLMAAIRADLGTLLPGPAAPPAPERFMEQVTT